MYKKIFIIILTIIMFLFPTFVLADDEDEDVLEQININQEIIESSTTPVKEPIINSPAAVIFDRTTGQIIYGKNENTKRAMASTTKIMTAIIVLENSNLSDIVTISKKAATTSGSCLKLKTGDKITVNHLLYGLMLRSRE